ncbi:hypothetical protein PBT90_18350 [Algoriphagus halophytocola]|uniref:Uncharacterized protein n=1 Tax=Algoriphagus halophytocola TaxID=2991499 RepID=A0ABY6MEU5_9BACT|nr:MULTISPECIES: hypothetical protein [unclassified Algoriphagus]UZD21479.1 hypothetical protein OM944_12480 [Algoriphagus sp. TR-M5]WBL42691.1 hypothetical protein PBT90_18350 [Algoriphagus sp. TR-M9]
MADNTKATFLDYPFSPEALESKVSPLLLRNIHCFQANSTFYLKTKPLTYARHLV